MFAVLALVAVCLSAGLSGTAWAQSWLDEDPPLWEEIDAAREAREDSLLAQGPEVREPFFAFLLAAARGDSLGVWNGAALQEYAADQGRPSRFPMEMIRNLSRRRPTPDENRSWPRSAVKAVWELELTEDLDRDLPYSILGYHPGALRGSRRMLLTEVQLGALAVVGEQGPVTVSDVLLFRLDRGHLLLDVDGLVDRLLGKALDDSATLGFVLARHRSALLGLAVSVGKDGRRIYGEFDFRRDKVLPNGRPVAQALSAAGRRLMLEDYQGPELGIWVDN